MAHPSANMHINLTFQQPDMSGGSGGSGAWADRANQYSIDIPPHHAGQTPPLPYHGPAQSKMSDSSSQGSPIGLGTDSASSSSADTIPFSVFELMWKTQQAQQAVILELRQQLVVASAYINQANIINEQLRLELGRQSKEGAAQHSAPLQTYKSRIAVERDAAQQFALSQPQKPRAPANNTKKTYNCKLYERGRKWLFFGDQPGETTFANLL